MVDEQVSVFEQLRQSDLVVYVPLQEQDDRSLNLEATVDFDSSLERAVQDLLEDAEGSLMANKNVVKKRLADTIRNHVTVQVEEV